PPAHGQALVAGDESGEHAEHAGLDLRQDEFAEPGQQRDPVDEGAGVDALQQDGEQEAAEYADRADQTVEQQGHEGGGGHTGNDEAPDRVDAEHLHRIDLLADGAGPEVGADGGGAGPGHDQHRDHGADLGGGAERGALTRPVRGTEIAQEDVEREADQHRERDGHEDRGEHRDAGDEPRLLDELTALPDDRRERHEGVQRQRDELADALEGRVEDLSHGFPP